MGVRRAASSLHCRMGCGSSGPVLRNPEEKGGVAVSITRVKALLKYDFLRAYRSPALLWLLIIPFAITFLLQVILAALLEPRPRICLYDPAGSEVTEKLSDTPGVDLEMVESREEMLMRVEYNNSDIAIYLPEDFDEEVSSRNRPELDFYISGSATGTGSIMGGLLVLDVLRDMEGSTSPFRVSVHDSGEESGSIVEKLVPAMVVLVLIVAGVFSPAFLLVQDKEQGTLSAVLATPVSSGELLTARWISGFVLTMGLSAATLLLNGLLSSNTALPLFLAMASGTLVCTSIGIIYGSISKDAKTLYTLIKSLNILLIGPVAFFVFSGLPEWIAKLFPTYWFIQPIYAVSLEEAGPGQVLSNLLICTVIGIILGLFALYTGRNIQKGTA
ncbi:MAG: ABC transporter permease subunit [Candidatus Aegiribacteria sp.]|nr:ABC transporter permease subunit [Candidatus Aegiribacteria sp.]MBD3295654.1 ABC transporter permease subunit [Candidatus Fermentibacteria bacterium]